MNTPKELIYQTEFGPEDELLSFVYEVEPYDPGYRYDRNGDGCPPSGGYATVIEIRKPDGSAIPEALWAAAGLDEKALGEIEGRIYTKWAEDQSDEPDYPEPDDDD